ncbi:aspartic peptidase domain-containing protein [Coniochaeta sp. 2T2.1]|nr:aspartic peptidase domain-containing protein [Coniochaeta sp. 2T2.1]
MPRTTTDASAEVRRRRPGGALSTREPPYHQGNAGLYNAQDMYYITDITVGNTTVPVTIDTGSSDTWFVRSPFTCVDYYGMRVAESKCGFGTKQISPLSQGHLDNAVFARSYADGTYVYGSFGFDDVVLGGVTIQHQQLAVVNNTYWYGDGKTSGLLGLAYPLMTGMDGNVPAYNPIFTNMWERDLIMPLFTLGLSRDTNGTTEDKESYLAFGGLPPVEYDDSTWGRTPILSMATEPGWGLTGDVRGLYIISADAYVYGKLNATAKDPYAGLVVDKTQFPILIDCGSSLTRLPSALAKAIFKSFSTPPQYLSNDGGYYAPCNARVPAFGVRVGSETYYMSPDDLLRQNARDVETGRLCRVGIIDADGGPYTLGVTFLANVVAVFDVGNDEVRFAKRLKY